MLGGDAGVIQQVAEVPMSQVVAEVLLLPVVADAPFLIWGLLLVGKIGGTMVDREEGRRTPVGRLAFSAKDRSTHSTRSGRSALCSLG